MSDKERRKNKTGIVFVSVVVVALFLGLVVLSGVDSDSLVSKVRVPVATPDSRGACYLPGPSCRIKNNEKECAQINQKKHCFVAGKNCLPEGKFLFDFRNEYRQCNSDQTAIMNQLKKECIEKLAGAPHNQEDPPCNEDEVMVPVCGPRISYAKRYVWAEGFFWDDYVCDVYCSVAWTCQPNPSPGLVSPRPAVTTTPSP